MNNREGNSAARFERPCDMTNFRFLHISDLHLGKPYGRFDDEVRTDLRKARQDLISAVIATCHSHSLSHILVAGDTFDQEAPTLRLIRQTLTAMGDDPSLNWWIIPGNHDSLAADLIWQTFANHAPQNVHVLSDDSPVELSTGAWLLPVPCPVRAPGYDLTGQMANQVTPIGALRIGLAHGGVVNFRPEEPSAEVIPPDRAERAQLDYLALGDWHGTLKISPYTWYSGAPERDRFKHIGRGVGLLVNLSAPGQLPQVQEIAIGRYDWQALDLNLSPGMEPIVALHRALPADTSLWRNTLVKLQLLGHLHLADRLALQTELTRIAPEFCHFEWSERQLRTEYQPDDLDEIARSGALRVAADLLKDEADNQDLARSERDVADAALTRLYSLVKANAQ